MIAHVEDHYKKTLIVQMTHGNNLGEKGTTFYLVKFHFHGGFLWYPNQTAQRVEVPLSIDL